MYLLVASVGKAWSCFHIDQPWQILQAFYSMKNCPIVKSLVLLPPSLLLPMEGFVGPEARVPLVSFYAWNQGTLHSPITKNPKNPNQANQPWLPHSSGRPCCKDWGNHIDILHQEIETKSIHLLWSVIPPLWRIWKEFPPKFFSLACIDCSNQSNACNLTWTFIIAWHLLCSSMSHNAGDCTSISCYIYYQFTIQSSI